MKLNPHKCYFRSLNITFFRHVVNMKCSHPNSKKVTTTEGFPISKIVINVKMFLGLTRYYKNFLFGYAKIASPLFELTKKDHKFS